MLINRAIYNQGIIMVMVIIMGALHMVMNILLVITTTALMETCIIRNMHIKLQETCLTMSEKCPLTKERTQAMMQETYLPPKQVEVAEEEKTRACLQSLLSTLSRLDLQN